MRIGIYDPYLDDLGGGEKYMMTIAECLSKHHDVSVFWNKTSELDQLRERFSLDLDKVKLKKNIFSPEIHFSTRLAETRKYDVLIILSDGSIPFVLSKKLFLHIQQPLALIAGKSWKRTVKLRRVNAIFYNSEFTRSFNEKFLQGVPSKIIYPPVKLYPQKTQKQNIILHVGRFRVANVDNDDFKKQQVLVDAFKDLVDKGLKNWKFIVATSTQNEEDAAFIKMLSSANGYPISFEINRSNRELWDMYNKAKIYWHASGYGEDLMNHPEYAEHFGISTVEAMGVGAVPVVINAGGQKEIVTEDVNGLFWNTLSELQDKTQQLIDDTKRWELLSTNAREQAKKYSKEIFSQAIEDLMQK